MGRVYAATHLPSGEAVAAKILTATPGPETLSELRREVHSMASLSHPHILSIFDQGVVNADDEAPAPVGAPWLIMERASAGSVATAPPTTWEGAHRLLVQLLDALAHAHSRGVIHRDLKLANLLVCDETDRRPGLKLADFGVAWSLGTEGPRVAGSPHSMAPEQAAGAVWALGPSTDLYAVGCIAWELATGREVFAGLRSKELALAHRDQAPPAFEPRMAVPAELEDWVLWLLSKSVHDRPALAADAAFALSRLGPPTEGEFVERFTGSNPSSTPTFTFSNAAFLPSLPLPEAEGLPHPIAPFATEWERDEPPFPLHLLGGAGASLFGVRRIPFVHRHRERATVWSALGETASTSSPQLVTIAAHRGLGGSRLTEWVAHRAQELGAAQLWRAGAGGIIGMLADGLGLSGVPSTHWSNALSQEAHAETLVAAVRGKHPDAVGVALGLLARRSRRRPVLLWLDDAHRSPALVDLAKRILDTPDVGPILVCMVVQPEKVEASIRTALPELVARSTAKVTLDPLPSEAMAALLRGALGLAPHVVGTLQVRAAGHPGFALNLLRDWVADGALTTSTDGFAPPTQRLLAIPDATRLWRERIEKVRPRWSPAAAEAGWIAAALGPRIDQTLWRTVVRRLGEEVVPTALDDLVERGLASRHATGWDLAHPLLREAWLETRLPNPRKTRLSHVAAVLEQDEAAALHAGRLWLEAGMPERAHPLLLRAAHEAEQDSRFDLAEAALSRRNTALDDLETPAEAPLRREGEALRAQVLARSGRAEEGMAAARTLAVDADVETPEGRALLRSCGSTAFVAGDWDQAEAWLLAAGHGDAQSERLLGEIAWNRLDEEDARARGLRALALALEQGKPVQAAAAANSLGNIERYVGSLELAAQYFRQSLELAGSSKHAVVVRLNLAWLELDRGQAEQAHPLLGQLLADLEAVYDRFMIVGAASMLTYSAALVGDGPSFDRAADRCRQLDALVTRHAHNTTSLFHQAAKQWNDREDAPRSQRAHQLAWDASAGLPEDQREAFQKRIGPPASPRGD